MAWIDCFQEKLPSRRIKEPYRSAMRFMLLGTIGSFVQTGFFLLVMIILSQPAKDTLWYYVAFVAGFVLEMIPNYFASCCYTFGQPPSTKNASGFVLARAVNLVIQMVLLPVIVKWLSFISDGIVSLIVIFVAGIVNYLMQRLFFKPKKSN